MFMKEMLLALKKAVDEALAADTPTEEIPLAAFPSHVVKSLELILDDSDVERAAHRLATLQAELDEACALLKQGDDAQVIRVVVHEEPELTAKPRVEKELPVPYDSGTAGYKPAKRADLAPMLAKLAREVAALKQALAAGDAEQRKAENDQADAKAKTKPRAASGKVPPKPKSRAAGSTDGEQDAPKPTKKGEAQGTARVPAEWADWPMDMNWTMPDAEPEAMDPDFDWGADPEDEP
jgi:hypothetical protein